MVAASGYGSFVATFGDAAIAYRIEMSHITCIKEHT